MNKIINGKKYDTETAKCVGFCQNKYPGDLYYSLERLYQKKTGEFFLYGAGESSTVIMIGDPMRGTHYELYGIDGFFVISNDDAKAWAEQYLNGDEYEELFGEVEE